MRLADGLAPVLLLVVLAGCSSAPTQYQKSNADPATLEQDQRGCRGESGRVTKDLERRNTNSMLDSGVPLGSGGSIQTDMMANDLRSASRQAFEQCMARRGWALKKVEPS